MSIYVSTYPLLR